VIGYVEAFLWRRDGHLPAAGGMLDQTRALATALLVVEAEWAACEARAREES
jgi:hypothetical protein